MFFYNLVAIMKIDNTFPHSTISAKISNPDFAVILLFLLTM